MGKPGFISGCSTLPRKPSPLAVRTLKQVRERAMTDQPKGDYKDDERKPSDPDKARFAALPPDEQPKTRDLLEELARMLRNVRLSTPPH